MKPALIFAIQFLATCLPAHAYENENGAVMICDTQKQVERYVQIFDGNARAAISAINTEENDPNACTLTDILRTGPRGRHSQEQLARVPNCPDRRGWREYVKRFRTGYARSFLYTHPDQRACGLGPLTVAIQGKT